MFLVIFALFGMLTTGAVFPEEDHDRARMLKEAGEIRPLAEFIEDARKRHAGKIIEVELEEEGGKFIYELEILGENGVVVELKYDAKSGALLKMEAEDED